MKYILKSFNFASKLKNKIVSHAPKKENYRFLQLAVLYPMIRRLKTWKKG